MKYSALLLLIFCVAVANGQQNYFDHASIRTKVSDLPNIPARDFWFSMPRNYESQSGKYYELFVSSQKKTTVNIEVIGSSKQKIAVEPFQIATFFIPLGWEMTTSGVVENKAIHVWSDDADLNVYFLSRNPFTSDGSPVIPVTGWGKEYVVAGYQALYEGFGTFTYDYPSEFTITASRDSTVCTIIPSCDLRLNGQPDTVEHKKGTPFNVVLQRGQCLQYMTVLAKDADNFDVTGTIVRSNKPVGIIGASQCPNIPPGWQYCDHVCEIIPPVDLWGKTYFTIPFADRRGGDTHLIVASKDNQIIYRNGAVHCILNQFEKYFRPDVTEASTWTSDAPFLLVQYINSTTWQDENGQDNAGIGDPAMAIVNPKEQYTNTVLFLTPLITAGTGFKNFCNVIVHKDAVNATTMDGIPIKAYPNVTATGPIPYSNYTGFRVRALTVKGHVVKSDSGVGVYAYGYGSYDSYAWGTAGAMRHPGSADTSAPIASWSGDCYCTEIAVKDNGAFSEKLFSVSADSLSNMKFSLQTDPFAKDSVQYSLCVIDSTKAAYARVASYDGAMNELITTTTYRPNYVLSTPSSLNFGKVTPGIGRTEYLCLTNMGTDTADILSLQLASAGHGFTIDSGQAVTLKPGDSVRIKILFKQNSVGNFSDHLNFTTSCESGSILLYAGTAPPRVEVASSFTDSCIAVGDTISRSISFANKGEDPVSIDTVFITPNTEFILAGSPAFPVVVGAGATWSVPAMFTALSGGNKTATAQLKYNTGGVFFDSISLALSSCAVAAGVENDLVIALPEGTEAYRSAYERLLRGSEPYFVHSVSPNPARARLKFIYGVCIPEILTLDIYDMLGHIVSSPVALKAFQKGIYEMEVDISKYPPGGYFYRLSGAGKPVSGKFIVSP